MPAGQTGRQCVATSSTLRGEGSVCRLLPEPNGEPDVEEQSSVERAEGMNGFLSKLQLLLLETHGFITASTESRP